MPSKKHNPKVKNALAPKNTPVTPKEKEVSEKISSSDAPIQKELVLKKDIPLKSLVKTSHSCVESTAVFAWALVVLLLGIVAGTLGTDAWMIKKFDAKSQMVVWDDTTWMPVKGKPVPIIVLSDSTCGEPCSTAESIAALKQNITPALVVKEVDVRSEEGQKLIQSFALVSVPQFFFGKEIESIKAADGSDFVKNLPEGILTLKENLYYLDSAKVGFSVGKFITTPQFADLDTEPKKGTGAVQVVEFTDYQCPYCKRLHDQNKALIKKLVSEGKITYILKDFPLGFHAESAFAHKVANCVLLEGGYDKYWEMHDLIFDNTEKWSGKGEAALDVLKKLAEDLDMDISTCMEDKKVSAEIAADQLEGTKYGVQGTPALFIGSKIMPGAIAPEAFQQAVDAESK